MNNAGLLQEFEQLFSCVELQTNNFHNNEGFGMAQN
jgi:hypothetical protein